MEAPERAGEGAGDGGLSPVRRRLDVVTRLIEGQRYAWRNERELQDQLEEVFVAARLPMSREPLLSVRDRPDFLIGDIAVEVKVAGGFEAVLRQVRRYTEHPEVAGVLLATTVARHRLSTEEAAAALTWAKPLHFAWVRHR